MFNGNLPVKLIGKCRCRWISKLGSLLPEKRGNINSNFIKICCNSIDYRLKWKWIRWLSMLRNDCNKSRQGVEIRSVYKWLSMTKLDWHKLGWVIESKAVKELKLWLIVVIFEFFCNELERPFFWSSLKTLFINLELPIRFNKSAYIKKICW